MPPVTATGAAATGVSTAFDKELLPAETATRSPAARKPEDRWTPQISRAAISKIVEAAVRSVPGTTEKSSGFDKITGRSCPRYDIDVDTDMDAVSIEAFIAVTWPSPVTAVAEEVRQTIIQWVKDFTGIAVAHANVTVAHVEPGGPRISRTHLDKHSTKPVITPVVVTPNSPHIPVVTKKWDITPHDVVSPDCESVRHITVPEPIEVSGVTVAAHPPMREVTVAPQRELSPITVTPEAPLTPISSGTAPEIQPIRVKRPMPQVPVTVKPAVPLTPISVSPTPVVVPEAPRPVEVMRVRQPAPHRLAAVTKDTPIRLREIEVAKTPVRRVQEPGGVRLQAVVTPNNHRVVRPEVPQPKRLARIVTRGARIHHIADPADHVVRPGIAPTERPLKRITVSPANVYAHKKGGFRR